ncbi:MAG: dethiobiotin synthase [Bacteroidota bacterium]|nr:dethiobiotin synthase [Bacteroidota bacterium]
MKKYFVTGIGTDVGKTIVSAIITEALHADYWKPIQTGSFNDSDTPFLKKLIKNNLTQFHKEAYHFKNPLSPHAAAYLEGKAINTEEIIIPETDNILIIEGAGGVMVPLNNNELMIDLIKKFDAEVILVSRNYLGSINHTLLTVEAIQNKGINIKGIVFNNSGDKLTEDYIIKYTGLNCLLKLPHLNKIDKESIENIANTIDKNIFLK